MSDFFYGDYAYGTEPLTLPRAIEQMDGSDGKVSLKSKDQYPSGSSVCLRQPSNDSIEKWTNPAANILCWFRWITSHQITFILWQNLSIKLRAIAGSSKIDLNLEEQIDACIVLIRACSYLFVYASSFNKEQYNEFIRPYMLLQHRAFTAKWAADYAVIPNLFKKIFQSPPPCEASVFQAFRNAVEENKNVHILVAQRLVPNGGSLLKNYQKQQSKPCERTENAQFIYDAFFLVKRVAHESRISIAQSLARRLDAVFLDVRLNAIQPEAILKEGQTLMPSMSCNVDADWPEVESLLGPAAMQIGVDTSNLNGIAR